MMLLCVQNQPAELAPSQRLIPPEYESVYPLTIGRSYPIVGMMIFGSVLNVLVEDDSLQPLMAPAAMFAGEMGIPPGWKFCIREGVRPSSGEVLDQTMAVWGYAELVEKADHYAALTEWHPEAMKIFRSQVAAVRSACEDIDAGGGASGDH